MAEDAPYIVYVAESKAYESALEHNIAIENEGEYADEEYLDFSNEEEDESDSNSEDGEGELHNDTDTVEHQVTIKQEAGIQPVPFKWSHAATIHLIEAYQSFETSLISGELSMSQVWDLVAENMQRLGCEVTPQHCKNKFGSLKQIYEKSKEQEINSGVPVKKWIYMDLMEPIMTEMEKYRSYSNDAWDSPKCKEVRTESMQEDNQEKQQQQDQPVQGVYKWENPAILLLIDQYRKYQGALESGTISQKILFRLLEKNMQNSGYQVTATQCMVKIHSLKKTYKNIKEYNQVNRVIPRRWRYYDLMDSIIQGSPDTGNYDSSEVSKTLAEIKSEEPTPQHVFKWSRRAIEILVAAYREHRPPLHPTKMSRHNVWTIVVHRLRKAGYNVSVGQCKSKISGMLKLYKRNESGAGGRAWNVRGGWYSRLIESLVDKPKTTHKEDSRKIRTEEAAASDRRPESVLDQLIICEENRERRHRENLEQRQQLIDIMGQLLEKLS